MFLACPLQAAQAEGLWLSHCHSGHCLQAHARTQRQQAPTFLSLWTSPTARRGEGSTAALVRPLYELLVARGRVVPLEQGFCRLQVGNPSTVKGIYLNLICVSLHVHRRPIYTCDVTTLYPVPQAGHLPGFLPAMRDHVATGRWTGDEQMDRYDHLWVLWVTPQGRWVWVRVRWRRVCWCMVGSGVGARTVRYLLVCQYR